MEISDWMACSWATVERRRLVATASPRIWLEFPKPRSMVSFFLVEVGEDGSPGRETRVRGRRTTVSGETAMNGFEMKK